MLRLLKLPFTVLTFFGLLSAVSADLDSGLVRYMKFEEGSGEFTYDSSGYDQYGTCGVIPDTGSYWTTGYQGDGIAFSYKRFVEGAIPHLDYLTASAWVKPDSFRPFSALVAKGNDNHTIPHQGSEWHLNLSGRNRPGFTININGQCSGIPDTWIGLASPDSIPLNEWSLVTGTYDGDSLRIYVNGVLKNKRNAPYGALPECGGPFRMGIWVNGASSSSSTGQFEGIIDEVRVYNRALSGSEINNLYSSVVLYLCNDTNTFPDSSGFNHVMEAVGNVVYDTINEIRGEGCAKFYRNTDYLSTINSNDWHFSTSDFTIDFWVRHDTLAYYNPLIGQCEEQDYRWNISTINNDSIQFYWEYDGVVLVDYIANFHFNTNQWYHIAFTRNDSAGLFFINGKSIIPHVAYNVSPNAHFTSGLELGPIDAPLEIGLFNGRLDNVRITKGRALWTEDFNNTLLLHMDNSTFSDSSFIKQHAVTKHGNPICDSTTKKLGAGAMHCNGTTDYLTFGDSDDWYFDSSNFTIDFWVKFDSLPDTYQYFIDQTYDVNGYNKMQMFLLHDHRLYMTFGYNAVLTASYYTENCTLSTNTWYHIAFERNNTDAYIFVNGVSQTLVCNNPFSAGETVGNITAPLSVGAVNVSNSYHLKGYIDELRIIKGVAKWTSNFTPPNNPYK